MLDGLFNYTTLQASKQALDVYAERGRVHARNIANAETPGYRSQEVRFEDDLQLALRTTGKGGLERTHKRHLGLTGNIPGGRLQFRNPTSAWNQNGINDVDIDREMTDVARNTMRFTVAADMVRKTYEGMRKAISGRVS